MIQLVAFLGNYGREYEMTRHNVAWLFEKSISLSSRLSYQNKFKSEYASIDFEDFIRHLCDRGFAKTRDDGSLPMPKNYPAKIHFIKPQTYMNLSGEAIGEVASFYKIPASDILVVHDEIELVPGITSLKWAGGLGGHNGLRSTKTVLGTADFWRLRFGVGKPANGNVADHVLGKFTDDEQIILSQVFAASETVFYQLLMGKNPEGLLKEWSKKKVMA